MKTVDNYILIYYFFGEPPKGEKGYDKVIFCARDYAQRMDLDCSQMDYIIKKEKKGKPYFLDNPIKFSLSHSHDLWMCAFSTFNIGIDVERINQRDIEKVSRRYYSEYEQEYIENGGIEAFYKVWTFKEAVGKFTGNGIFADKYNIDNLNDEALIHVEYFNLPDSINLSGYIATGVWESKYSYKYDFIELKY